MTGRPGYLTMEMKWRKIRAAPRLYPLRSLVCTLFNRGGSKGAFRLPGAGGDHVHCTVEPRPVIFGVENSRPNLRQKVSEFPP